MTDLRQIITSYHSDGTDYINDDLESAVFAAISPQHVFLNQRSLAPLAAILAVLDWVEANTPNHQTD